MAPCTSAPELDVGAFAMGQRLDSLPRDAVSHHGECSVTGQFDCGFEGADGFAYTLYGRVIVRKEFAIGAGAAPFGLSRETTPEQALAVLHMRSAVQFEIVTLPTGQRAVTQLGTLKNASDHAFFLYVIFDAQGHASEISVQGPPTEED